MYHLRRSLVALGLLCVTVLPSHQAFAYGRTVSLLPEQCALYCIYNGGGDYLYVDGTLSTLSMDQQMFAELPSPTVQTVCDKMRMSLVERLLPVVALLMKVGCYGYKGYAWGQWLQVRWAIHQAALHHGCAIFILSPATVLRGSRVHLADYLNGRTISFLSYHTPTYVLARVDSYMPRNYHLIQCMTGLPLIYRT